MKKAENKMAPKKVHKKIVNWMTSETEITSESKKLLAYFFLVGAIVFGCLYYGLTPKEFWLDPFFFLKENKLIPRLPNLHHGLLGLALCLPLYARNILPFKSFSPYFIFILILNMLFFAVISQLVLGPSATLKTILTSKVLILALILSWVGMRSVAGLAWILLFGLAAYNIIDSSVHLKHWGMLFLICTLPAILLQSNLNPKEFFHLVKKDFKGFSESEFSDKIRHDVNEGIEFAKQIGKKGTEVVAKTAV